MCERDRERESALVSRRGGGEGGEKERVIEKESGRERERKTEREREREREKDREREMERKPEGQDQEIPGAQDSNCTRSSPYLWFRV